MYNAVHKGADQIFARMDVENEIQKLLLMFPAQSPAARLHVEVEPLETYMKHISGGTPDIRLPPRKFMRKRKSLVQAKTTFNSQIAEENLSESVSSWSEISYNDYDAAFLKLIDRFVVP